MCCRDREGIARCCGGKGVCNAAVWATLCTLLGIGAIVAAFILPPMIKKKIDDGICENICIPEEKQQDDPEYWKYDLWLTNKNQSRNPPEYYRFYLYNITNAALVMTGTKPQLTLLGPYTYRVHRSKFNVTQNVNEGTVSYENSQRFEFHPSLSVGKESDMITSVNLPLLGGYWRLYSLPLNPLIRVASLLALDTSCDQHKNEGIDRQACLFHTRNVSDMLFHQYSVAAETTNSIYFKDKPFKLDVIFGLFTNCSDSIDCHMKNTVSHNFGLGGKYNTISTDTIFGVTLGTFAYPPGIDGDISTTEKTGKTVVDDVRKITRWFGNTSIYIWNEVESVQGNLLQFKPGLNTNGGDSPLLIWEEFLMRQCNLYFEKKVTLHDVTLLRYSPSESFFGGMDPKYYGPNITGLINATKISETQYGVNSPVYASRPFLAGAPSSLTTSYGCSNCPPNPSPRDYESYIDVEPTLGKVLRGNKLGQINAWIGQPFLFDVSLTKPYSKVPEMFMPIVYFNYSSAMTEEQSKDVKDGLNQISFGRMMSVYLFWGGLIGGCLLSVFAVVLCCVFVRLRRKLPVAFDNKSLQ